MLFVLELLALFSSWTDAKWSLDLLFATSVWEYKEHKFKSCRTWKDLCSPRERAVCHVNKTKQTKWTKSQPNNKTSLSPGCGQVREALLPALCAVCFKPPSCSVAGELAEMDMCLKYHHIVKGRGGVPVVWGERSSALCCHFGAAPARSWGSRDCFNPAKISAADAAKRSVCVLWWVAELNEGTNPTASYCVASSGRPECQYWHKGWSCWGRKGRWAHTRLSNVIKGAVESEALSEWVSPQWLILGCG